MLGVWRFYARHGDADLLAAMALSGDAGSYGTDALAVLLGSSPGRPAPAATLLVSGVLAQDEVNRQLTAYKAWVRVDVVLEEVAR